CPTPWPCFVIVARKDFYENNKSVIENILEVINNTTIEFKQIPSIDKTLASRYEQKLEDIQEWMKITKWSQKQLTEKQFENIQTQLQDLGIIENKLNFSEVIK